MTSFSWELCAARVNDTCDIMKVVYNRVCPYCDGQIMSIYIGRKRMSSICIKCKKEAPKYVVEPRPICTEERLGRLMEIEKRKERYKIKRLERNDGIVR